MARHLQAAAKALIRAEPEIARHFSEAQIEEMLRITVKRLRVAGLLLAQED